MPIYLYTGNNRNADLVQLATSLSSLRFPVYVARFGVPAECHSLAALSEALPLDLVDVRLPGLGMPCTYTPMDQVAVQTVLAMLCRIIVSGDYCLIILDGVREAMARGLFGAAALSLLVRNVPAGTEIAMT